MMQSGYRTAMTLFWCMQKVKIYGVQICCPEVKKWIAATKILTMIRVDHGLQVIYRLEHIMSLVIIQLQRQAGE